MRQEKVSLTENINPHFYAFWNTKRPYVIAKGGRGSFKSSVISIKLVFDMVKAITNGHRANVVCIRENASYLRDSVYNQILWALNILKVSDQFRTWTSPLKIEHVQSGSAFYFYGANDPMKLKSNNIGDIIAIWFEEFANLRSIDVFDQSVPTFIRQKPAWLDQVEVYCSYNPPKNPYLWINEWITQRENDPSFFIDHSTYLDDELGFTTKQQLDMIERYKESDYDYYRWLYLGEVVGLGTNVYNMDLFHPANSIPEDDYITDIYYGMDAGHEVSATTVVAVGLTRKGDAYLLDTYYYSPAGKTNKKPPSELSKDIHDFIGQVTERYDKYPTRLTMDSAEGALDNQYYSMYGIRWHKVHKLKEVDMIDRVQDLLAQGRFYYLDQPNNKIFIKEHQKYQWDENTLQSDSPKVIKEDDHTVDAFKYCILDSERDFGLKW